ncbi:helix-turn-helix transcriptional regulator [Svornostia abyssi]|uniref:Helix-turn-helix transcriptional regulator n=1 Tax=Svornostia abyssi TaxID=2898438 RepID=A0ABY5PD61_9ACTN|nr:helix-turn-helix transcriptional regulator [Parviterribacteraceae bacterium J379]
MAATLVSGELRARQGRTDEARALFEEAGPVGLLGLGGLALEAGDARAAADTAARVLRSLRDDTVLPRLPALELQVRALAALGEDTSGSLAAAQEIATRLGTPYLRARVRLLTGEAALAAGDADSAREAFEDAIDGFDAHAAPYDLALSRLALARALHALGRTEHARLEAAAAREVFAALGAKRDLERADELTAEPAAAALSELTPRELDVLRLVAQGHSDQEIADALVLSPHTVHRHVANIRAKLRLSSRAAAVAYAARAGLAVATGLIRPCPADGRIGRRLRRRAGVRSGSATEGAPHVRAFDHRHRRTAPAPARRRPSAR